MQTTSYRYIWIFGLVLLFTFPAAAQTWRQVGPPGGDVQSLAAVPGSTRTLFLGTSDGHIFGSRDAGEHWELLGRIGANHDDVIMSIVVDARSADTLYATSWTLSSHGGGVYRSGDAGHNWQLIGLEGHTVRALAAAPSNPDILVAGAIDGAGAASHFATRHGHRRGDVGSGAGKQPVVLLVNAQQVSTRAPTEFEIVR